MSIEPETPGAPTGGLQFDRAEFDEAAPAMACTGCKQPIAEQYYDVNGSPFCPSCRDGVEAYFAGGSRVARLVRALVFGGAAALAAAVGYFAFIHFSGMDWSLISVLVGLMIGKAVHGGSRNRGGLPYQLIAVALTYLSIGVTYTAVGFFEQARPDPADLAAAAGNDEAPAAGPAAPGEGPAPEKVAEGVKPMPKWAVFMIYLLIVPMAPVLLAKSSPITALIVGFALWEAWKLNGRTRVAISGPYRVGGEPGGLAAEAPAHA